MKRGLILTAVFLLPVAMLLTWLTVTESGLRWVYAEAKSYLPAELSVQVIKGRLIGPITLTDVEYSQDATHIKADQIVIDWTPRSLLTARVNISLIIIEALDIVLPKATNTEQPLVLPEIDLPWRVALKDAVINGLSIHQDEQVIKLKKINLDASTLFSQINIKKLDIIADSFQLYIQGWVKPVKQYPHDFKISWQTRLPSEKILSGKGQLVGDMKLSQIKQQFNEPLALSLDGEIMDFLGQLNWHAKLQTKNIDTTQLMANWPALTGVMTINAEGDINTAKLEGVLKAEHAELGQFNADFKLQQQSDYSILIERLNLQAPRNNTKINASGLWQPGKQGGNIKLALNWENLRWPAQEQYWFNSAHGKGVLEGNLDQYQIKLDSDSPRPDILSSTWQVNAVGNLDGLNFQSIQVKALKGEALATGQLNWAQKLSWSAEVIASGIDPGGLWPQWPGQLNGKLTSSGRLENDQWIANVDIAQVSGKLRNLPVSLRSQANWRGDRLDITQFEVLSGSTKVNLQGQVGKTLKLNWNIASNNLTELHPDTKGQLHAKGQVSASLSSPFVEASFNGKALKLLTYEIGAIDGTLAADLFIWQKVDFKLAAQALKFNDYALSSLDVDADRQHMKMIAISDTVSTHIELIGEPQTKGWRGHLQRADLHSKDFTDWQLTSPVSINFNEKSIDIGRLCWHNNKEGKLCSTVDRKNSIWLSRTEINKLPLMIFAHWLPQEMKLNGVVNATADLTLPAPGQLFGTVQIELPSGSVIYPVLEGERDQWEYRSGQIKIAMTRTGLEANADILMSSGDQLKGQLSLPGAQLITPIDQSQPLQASAQLNIQDLGLVESFVPDIQDLKGHVDINLGVGGTLAQPRLRGSANLLNGTLRIPKLGLTITQLNIKGESKDLEKFNFNLEAHSGEGALAISGYTLLDKNAGWPTIMSIKGENIEVARIPEAQVQISPDLQVKIEKHTIETTGNVEIPYAKLQPNDVTTAARVSNDAVIIGGEQSQGQKWSIINKIRITLGKRVNFYGFGFEGLLGGSLLLEDEPGQLTKATGEINIPEGRYRAYGQRLEVEQGRLLFTGGPLTNPGLDIQAVRRVDNITAGVKVRGSLNQPKLELFSNPTMGQTEVLSYLLLGRPIESASGKEGAMMSNAALALGLSGGDRIARILGDKFQLDEFRVESSDDGNQASLVMGRYLSPKLYISYGVGLIDAINTLTARYQLSEKWQIEAESGEYQGADILYTIKR